MKLLLLLTATYFVGYTAESKEIDLKYLKCLVCRVTIDELEEELNKIDPSREMEIGNYRMDAQGNTKHKKIPMRQSEVHISDTLDKICEKMSDYVRATYKSNDQLTILKLIDASGNMNTEMGNVDIIQDGDLNKSLEYYCQGIVEEFEEPIISLLRTGKKSVREKLCTTAANLCKSEDFPDEDDTSSTEEMEYERNEL